MPVAASCSSTHAPKYLYGWPVLVWTYGLLLRLSCYFDGIVKDMMKKILAISLVVSITLLIILMQTTTPATIGPLGILITFAFIYIAVVCGVTFLLFWIGRIIEKLSSKVTVKRPIQSLTFIKAYYYASVISLAPVMLIGMQSVGEVGVYEVLLVSVFVAISCVYIAKRTK